jgi:thiol-disulfide isomerase/thioredoxin
MSSQHSKAFLLFYAPWCQNCKELSAAWREAGRNLVTNKIVIFAAVDCGEDASPNALCLKSKISKFPTVLFFQSGVAKADITNIQHNDGYFELLSSPDQYIKKQLKTHPVVQATTCDIMAGNCSIVAKIEELKRDRARLEEARENLRKAQGELEARALAADADRARLLSTQSMLEQQIGSVTAPSSELAELLDRAKRVVKDSPIEAINLLQDTATKFAAAYGAGHAETKATQDTVDELIKLTKLYQASLAEAGLADPNNAEPPCEDKVPHKTMILMEGAPASCTKLQPHCNHPESGSFVRKACPLTCGVCAEKGRNTASTNAGASAAGKEQASTEGAEQAESGGGTNAEAAVMMDSHGRVAREIAFLTQTNPKDASPTKGSTGEWRSVGRKVGWGAFATIYTPVDRDGTNSEDGARMPSHQPHHSTQPGALSAVPAVHTTGSKEGSGGKDGAKAGKVLKLLRPPPRVL